MRIALVVPVGLLAVDDHQPAARERVHRLDPSALDARQAAEFAQMEGLVRIADRGADQVDADVQAEQCHDCPLRPVSDLVHYKALLSMNRSMNRYMFCQKLTSIPPATLKHDRYGILHSGLR